MIFTIRERSVRMKPKHMLYRGFAIIMTLLMLGTSTPMVAGQNKQPEASPVITNAPAESIQPLAGDLSSPLDIYWRPSGAAGNLPYGFTVVITRGVTEVSRQDNHALVYLPSITSYDESVAFEPGT